MTHIRTAYGDNPRQAAPKCGKSLTEKHHAKACDINNIMAKYIKTGLIDHMNVHSPTYGDVTGADFKKAQDLVAEQKSIFEELPAEIRAEFNHDPAEYLDLVMTDEGVAELSEMLNPAPEQPEPEKRAPETPQEPSDGEASVSEAVT